MNRDLADYQEQYSKQPYEKYQVAFRKRKLKEILARYRHNRLLEVGCGLESIFLDVDTYEQMVIVEPAAIFYEKALQDAAQMPGKDITVVNALLEDAGAAIAGRNYDMVLVSSLLHEIPDQQRFLGTVHGLCGPDTVVHINVPNARSFHRLLAVEMGLIKSEFTPSDSNILFQQHTVFDEDLLCRVVQQAGFEVVESGSYSFKPFTHGQLQKMIDAGLITEAMLDGFYKMERYLPHLCSEIYVNVKKQKA
ncbi:hypothetical protein GCM10023093_17860 [Nemorincola caseinilytica]|uniref:Methyltransferase domain-containing protein n=1 Tax=Nemorincola caseinilytica TaxID=2054315 RepID=A0ABP8NGJ0_9BACT